MFESLKKILEENNKGNSPKSISFDFKLMFIYHIAMMILFGARPFNNVEDQILFTIVLSIILVAASVLHKVKSGWSWPGLSVMSIPGALFNLLFLYIFFAFTAYAMNPNISVPEIQPETISLVVKESWALIIQAISIPVFTPWYLAGIGIVVFNILSNLNLVSLKKAEFESQCKNS